MSEPDVIIVGSGPVGAVLASALATRQKRVLILESGGAISAPPGAHLRNQRSYQLNPDRFFEEIGRWCGFLDDQAPPSGLPGANQTEAVGGQSLIWTNNCPRPTAYLDQLDFLDQRTWKLRLLEAEKLLRVHSSLFDRSVRQARVESWLNKNVPQRQVQKLPLAAERLPDGTLEFTATRDILDLKACVSKVTVQERTRVVRFEHSGPRIDCLVAKDANGAQQKYRANNYVIAGGVFATPKLLYASGIRPPALGQYLHFHPLSMSQVVLDEELGAPKEIADPAPRLYLPPSASHPWHAMILRDIFSVRSSEEVDENRLVELQFFAPIEVRRENRMILDSSEPRFDVTLTKNDENLLGRMVADQHELAKLLGHFRNQCAPFFVPSGMSHPMGTCRIGEDPASSVADTKGRVHGFHNLFLAGASLIPFPIAVNPTLTCAAIALETAANIE
jgi:choline dehydrogenase-like flavoprotein